VTAGGLTARALRDQRNQLRNYVASLVALSGASTVNAANGFGYVRIKDWRDDADDKNRGNHGGDVTSRPANNLKVTNILDPHNAAYAVNHPGANNQWYFRIEPVNLAGAPSLVNYRQSQYIQTNYLVPISALASQAWQNFQANAFQQGCVRAAMGTARRYIRTHVPNYLTLNGAQLGDLLGLFTHFVHHVMYRIALAAFPGKLYAHIPVGSTSKNWFDHMIKSHVSAATLLLDEATANVVLEWYQSKNFAAAANAHVTDWLTAFTTTLGHSTEADLVTWGNRLTNLPAKATIACTSFVNLLPSLDITRVNNPLNTSPTGGGGAKVGLRVGAAPGVLSVVVESRDFRNPMNTASENGNVVNLNALFAQVMAQKTWDGGGLTQAV